MKTKSLSLLALSLLALAVPSAKATTYWWDLTGTSTWATAANWSNNFYSGGTTGVVPTSADTAFFNQLGLTAAATTVNISADTTTQSIGGIVFNNPTGGTTIATTGASSGSSTALNIGSGGILINSGASAVTLGSTTAANNISVSLNATQSWVNNSSNALTVQGIITAPTASTYTLTFGGSGATTINNTSTAGSGAINNPATSGTLAVVKTGAGTLTLYDVQASTVYGFSGGLTVNAGVVQLNNSSATVTNPINSANSLTLGGGAYWQFFSGGPLHDLEQTFNNLTLNAGASAIQSSSGYGSNYKDYITVGTVTRNAGATLNVSEVVANSKGTQVFMAGTSNSQVLDNGVAYATNYFRNDGTGTGSLTTAGDNWAAFSTAAVSGNYNVTFVGDTTYFPTTTAYTAATGTTLAGIADVSNAIDTTLAAGASVTSLRFSNASARTITITSGNLTTGGILISSAVGANTSTITGGTLKSAATVSGKDLVIINNASGVLNLSGTAIANSTAGATGLTKSGTGGLNLGSAANTYTGPTFINGGNIAIASDGTGASNPLGAYPGSTTANSITLNGGGLNTTASMTLAANRGVTLGGNGGGFYVGNSTTLNINGVIASAAGASTANSNGALQFGNATNTGTAILNGSNTFVGGILINNGEVKLGNAGALNSTAGSENAVAFGASTTGTLTLNGNSVVIPNLTGSASGPVVQNNLAGTATLTVGNSLNQGGTYAGILQDGAAGKLALIKNGTGTWVLSGASTFTGDVTISNGMLKVTNSGALGGGTKIVTITNNVGGAAPNLTLDGSGGNITLPNGISFTTSGTVIKNAAGNNTINGNVNLTFGNGDTFISSDGGSLTLAGTMTPIATGRNLQFIGNGNGAVTGVIQNGTGNNILPLVRYAGSGTWTISNANTYTSATTVTSGTLAISNDNNLGAAWTGGIQTLSFSNAGSGLSNGTIPLTLSAPNLPGGTQATANATVTGGVITAVTITNAGTGYTSAPTITQLGGSSNIIASIANLNLSATLQTNAAVTSNRAVTLSGTGTINTNGFNSTFSGPFTGSGALTKSGSGTLTLSGNSNYTSATTISAGTLQFAKTASLYNNTTGSWTSSNIKVSSSGTLALNVGGTNEFATTDVTTLLTNLGGANGGTSGGLASGSSIGFDTTNASGAPFTVANNIANTTGTGGGAIGLTKLGTNTLALTGTNTYTGVTTISAGTLQFGKTASLYNNTPANWTAANIKVSNTGTLALNVGGTNEFSTSDVTTLLTNLGGGNGGTSGGFAAGSSVAFDTTNASPTTFTVANNIANSSGTGGGAIGLTKLGTNTLVLTGTNTYTGNTTVNGGNLIVSGSGNMTATSKVIVTGGSLLVGANEVINNSATVTLSGGTLGFASGLGNATETLGALTLTANSTIDFGALAAAGSTHKFIFDSLAGLDTYYLKIYNWKTNEWFGGGSTQLIFNNPAGASAYLNHFTFYSDGGGTTFPDSGFGMIAKSNATEIVAVPEPGTILAGALLLGSLAFAERKRLRNLLRNPSRHA